jgi:hypothetical protein
MSSYDTLTFHYSYIGSYEWKKRDDYYYLSKVYLFNDCTMTQGGFRFDTVEVQRASAHYAIRHFSSNHTPPFRLQGNGYIDMSGARGVVRIIDIQGRRVVERRGRVPDCIGLPHGAWIAIQPERRIFYGISPR